MKAFGLVNKMKQKNLKKKSKSKCPPKKRSLSSSANSKYFFVKISWIGPWVSIIDWWEGHWHGSTYMVVSHKPKNSLKTQKTQKMHFLPVFELILDSHINALCINHPRTNPRNFHEKVLRIGNALKITFIYFFIFWLLGC